MAHQLREGSIYWVRDLNASASNSVIPSSSTAGVTVPTSISEGNSGTRVHVAVQHTVASGTVSLTVGLYGYTARGELSGTAGWFYLGSLNNASSMAADTSKWSPNVSTINVAEVFTVAGANYERYATRQVTSSTTTGTATTTFIGFPAG